MQRVSTPTSEYEELENHHDHKIAKARIHAKTGGISISRENSREPRLAGLASRGAIFGRSQGLSTQKQVYALLCPTRDSGCRVLTKITVGVTLLGLPPCPTRQGTWKAGVCLT